MGNMDASGSSEKFGRDVAARPAILRDTVPSSISSSGRVVASDLFLRHTTTMATMHITATATTATLAKP